MSARPRRPHPPPAWHPFGVALGTSSNGTKFAYVMNQPGSGASNRLFYCTMNSDGSFDVCTPYGDSFPYWLGGGFGMTFGTVNGVQYGYIGTGYQNENPSGLYVCALNADGTIASCAETPATSPPTWYSNGIAFVTPSNGVQYAYVSAQDQKVWKCTLNTDGTFDSCAVNNGGASYGYPWGVTVAKVSGGTQYAYVSDASNHHVYRCTITSDGTFGACTASDGGIGGGTWSPGGVAVTTVNGSQYAYVAGDAYNTSGVFYQCGVNSDGTLNACADTPSSTPGAPWSPISVAFGYF